MDLAWKTGHCVAIRFTNNAQRRLPARSQYFSVKLSEVRCTRRPHGASPVSSARMPSVGGQRCRHRRARVRVSPGSLGPPGGAARSGRCRDCRARGRHGRCRPPTRSLPRRPGRRPSHSRRRRWRGGDRGARGPGSLAENRLLMARMGRTTHAVTQRALVELDLAARLPSCGRGGGRRARRFASRSRPRLDQSTSTATA